MKNKRRAGDISLANFFWKQACMFDALIEYALCSLLAHDESK
jgi:hypothetical protein